MATSGKKCLSSLRRPKQNFLNRAKRQYSPCAIYISPAFREAEGGLWPLKARRHPCRSVARRLPISHRPPTTLPSARWPSSGLIPWQQNDTSTYRLSRATWTGKVPRREEIMWQNGVVCYGVRYCHQIEMSIIKVHLYNYTHTYLYTNT